MSDSPAYCCYFHSHGSFEDMDDVGLFMASDWEKRGDYIRSQGKWKIDQTDWTLFVGISNPDEEWRQKDDIEDFIVENFQFLNRLCCCPKVHFHLSMSYRSNAPVSVDFSSQTISLLGALKVSLGIYFSPALSPQSGGTVVSVEG